MKYIWIFICMLPMALLGQDFEARLDNQEFTIGDQEVVHLRIDNTQSVDTIDTRTWQELGLEFLDPVQSINIQSLRFTVFDTGYFVLPPLLAISNGDSIYSNDLAINVLSVATDSTQIAPIKDIVQEPISFWDIGPYVLGYILIVGLLLYFFLDRRPKQEPEVVEVFKPAHEIALQKLKLLENEGLWQKGEIKAYQSGLTFIIREYLENRFEVHALESTTDEILTSPRISSIDPRQKEELRNILNIADLVKFAKAKPTAEVHQKFMDAARQFIIDTKKVEVSHAEPTTED